MSFPIDVQVDLSLKSPRVYINTGMDTVDFLGGHLRIENPRLVVDVSKNNASASIEGGVSITKLGILSVYTKVTVLTLTHAHPFTLSPHLTHKDTSNPSRVGTVSHYQTHPNSCVPAICSR